MSDEAIKEAEAYLQSALESQRRLGYSGKVEDSVFRSAVEDAARAIDKLRRATRRRAHAAA
jgi:hypothetical protein